MKTRGHVGDMKMFLVSCLLTSYSTCRSQDMMVTLVFTQKTGRVKHYDDLMPDHSPTAGGSNAPRNVAKSRDRVRTEVQLDVDKALLMCLSARLWDTNKKCFGEVNKQTNKKKNLQVTY